MRELAPRYDLGEGTVAILNGLWKHAPKGWASTNQQSTNHLGML